MPSPRPALALTLLLLACDRPSPPPPLAPQPTATVASSPSSALTQTTFPSASASLAPPPPSSPPPLRAAGPFLDLLLDGLPTAVIAVPLGARGKRPVAVAAHGNYDRPEWQCQVLREVVGPDVFILCPRGVMRPDSPSPDDIRFTYSRDAALGAEIDAGLAALEKTYPDYADVREPLYTGFSLGAIMGVAIASRDPSRFRRLVLVEGGHDKWTHANAVAFAKGGGLRVLFVCSQAHCALDAKQASSRVERAGALAKVVRAKDSGHRYDGPVADTTKGALAWVTEGDPRF